MSLAGPASLCAGSGDRALRCEAAGEGRGVTACIRGGTLAASPDGVPGGPEGRAPTVGAAILEGPGLRSIRLLPLGEVLP